MPTSQNFFTDPKVAISLFALLIAIATLIWTMFTNWEQNRRWDALNLGRVEIKDVGFIMWKEITKEEATSTDWGYKPTIFSHTENRIHTGKYRIPYELILVDPRTKKQLSGSNGFFTLAEAQAELTRLGIEEDVQPEIRRHFQIQIDFQNKGSTIASDFKTLVKMKEIDKDSWVQAFKSKHGIALAPSATCNIVISFNTLLSLDFPKEINYEVEISYNDIHGELIRRKVPITYDSDMNYWSYGH